MSKSRFESSPARRVEYTDLVAVDSPAFFQFDCWLDAELELLVAQWRHAASPNAERAAQSAAGWRNRLGQNPLVPPGSFG